MVTLGAAVVLLRRGRAEEPAAAGEVVLKNPFSLTAAVKFGLLFAAVLLVVAAVERYFPGQGYYLVAALAGLTDVDAITLSMTGLARSGGAPLATVAGAIVVAALANTLVKCGLVVATAGAKLRRSIVAVTAASSWSGSPRSCWPERRLSPRGSRRRRSGPRSASP